MKIFPVKKKVTLEANPTSSSLSRFREFKDAGINRLSVCQEGIRLQHPLFLFFMCKKKIILLINSAQLGIQTFHEDGLRILGRDHNAQVTNRSTYLFICLFVICLFVYLLLLFLL